VVENKAVFDAELKSQKEPTVQNGRALSDYLLKLAAYPQPATEPQDRQRS
jgi:hypothetical protein